MDGVIDTNADGYGRKQSRNNIKFNAQVTHDPKSTDHRKCQRDGAN